MQRRVPRLETSKPSPLDSNRINTTLYELIEVVSEEVTSGEEHWVPFIVDHILEFRRPDS